MARIAFPITFVLGAGASAPLNFPLGNELVEIISRDIIPDGTAGRRILRKYIEKYHGFSPDNIERFGEALVSARPKSIDEFLGENPEFLTVGKACIACALIPREDPAVLRKARIRDDFWYEKFYEFGNTVDPKAGNISIVTFNYDRSLEQYVYDRECEDTELGEMDKLCVSRGLSDMIIHVYGMLGDLWFPSDLARGFAPALRESGHKYGPDLTLERIKECSSGIQIIHESRKSQTRYYHEPAAARIQESRTVCFLGFGYHETSLDRLNIELAPNETQFLGTAFAMSDGTRRNVHEWFRRSGRQIALGEPGEDIVSYLHNTGLLGSQEIP